MEKIKNKLSIASFLGLLFVVSFGVSCGNGADQASSGEASGQSFTPQLCFLGKDKAERRLELSGDNKIFTVKLVDGGKPDSAYEAFACNITWEKETAEVRNVNGFQIQSQSGTGIWQLSLVLSMIQIKGKFALDVFKEGASFTITPKTSEVTCSVIIKNSTTEEIVGEPFTVHWKQ